MSQQKSEISVRAPCSPFTFFFSFLEGGLALSYATQELASHVVPRALALLQQHLLFLTIPIFLLGDDSKEEQLCIIVLRCCLTSDLASCSCKIITLHLRDASTLF